jgi:hypothetical protein
MLNKIYIAVPFFVGLTAVGFATTNAIKDNKKTELLGYDKFVLCNATGDNCTSIKQHERLPFKINPPLGLDTAVNKAEINCLARNITQEAVRGYLVDKIHIGYATINRVKLNYARTICKVIAQKDAMSWYNNPAKRNAPPSPENIRLAKKLLKGNISNPSPDCMITNWYNVKYDNKESFNAKYMYKDGVCSHRPKFTPHFYMEVPLS